MRQRAYNESDRVLRSEDKRIWENITHATLLTPLLDTGTSKSVCRGAGNGDADVDRGSALFNNNKRDNRGKILCDLDWMTQLLGEANVISLRCLLLMILRIYIWGMLIYILMRCEKILGGHHIFCHHHTHIVTAGKLPVRKTPVRTVVRTVVRAH